MFVSQHLTKLFQIARALSSVLMLFILVSCLPQDSRPTLNGGNNSTDTSGSGNGAYPEPVYPVEGIFVQESGFQSTTNFSLPINFNDSFLVRGKELSKIVRALPNTTQFCLVGKYNYLPGSDKFLIFSGKPKSYTDLVKKTTEFYLQVEPSNDTANQNDCLNYNLTNTLYATASNPSVSFSLTQLCTDCTGAVTSGGLSLYYSNGEAVPTLNLSQLKLTISGSTNPGSNSCVESTLCQARSYDCCLNSQCVNDGAVRPGALTDPGFASALADVNSNPTHFVLYPQFYFVCPNRPDGSTSGGAGGGEETDPDYEAAIRIIEMTQLYQCLNKVDGEFSYCTVKFNNASTRIPGTFSVGESTPSVLEFKDDVTFAGFATAPSLVPPFATNEYRNRNIVKIFYAGQTLYDATTSTPTPLAPADGSFTARSGCTVTATNDCSGNDDLTNAANVYISRGLPTNAIDDNLYLSYKIDGTCTKLGASLARCSKTYYQNTTTTATSPFSTTNHDNTRNYYLPSYADLSMSVIVKLSEVVVPEDATTWSKVTGPNRVVFVSTPATNQKIEITYYVTSNVAALTKSKTAALATVNTMCQCGSAGNCNLRPVYSAENVLTNYECVYPSPTSNDPPANQTVYVSNKNVPHRYYDSGGVAYDEGYATAPVQEGTAFTYFNNDLLKPSNAFTNATTPNANAYVGFNEIYGSFATSGNQTAKPAKLVKVKKDKYYDIFTNSGAFSACPTCGSDYYSTFQKLFPQNFSGKGGGYTPDNYESRRENATSIYRADDLLYGRACFVPATMLPWTHVTSPTVSSVQGQRLTRLAGQHFLFANGYTRDWYGFDYGSLIGSFDGVSWFSIGNQRRIKATTNKLFLAVNAYYGDLSIDSNFNISVSETVAGAATLPDHDTRTDGAECQKSHFCSNDNDCFRQLGYDYSCQNVASFTTNWPQFDANGTEVVGSINRTLSSIVGGTAGQSKRCIYRGRGAPCSTSLTAPTGTFNNSTVVGALACSQNNMCQSLTTGSTSRFNEKIARFANTPNSQNLQNTTLPVSDTVGLGARLIGRPNDYYGTKAIRTGTNSSGSSLAANAVGSVCIPGKSVATASTTFDLNSAAPATRKDTSDKMFGIGVTMSGSMSSKYLNACPATDALGYSVQTYELPLGVAGSDLEKLTIAQNLSSNLLNMSSLVTAGIYNSSATTTDTQITAIGYQRNACLRAPGASCFSDMDCAPSNFIASKVKALDLSSVMNTAEEAYWEEELVCGNPDYKYLAPGFKNPTFDIKKNVCCREYGNTITVHTETDTSNHHWCDTTTEKPKVAGVNLTLASTNRYSRVHTAYDKMTCDRDELTTTKTFALSTKASTKVQRFAQILYQFKTLDTVNARTCCTQNWVRSFDTSNGGGHAWSQSKQQTIEKAVFEPLNWNANDNAAAENTDGYECQPGKQNFPSCEIKNFTEAEVTKYLTYFGSLELIGIPQVAIKVPYPYDSYNAAVTSDDILSVSIYDRLALPSLWQDSLGTVTTPVEGTTVTYSSASGGNHSFEESATKKYFSAADTSKFDISSTGLKKIFSESEFNCCLPSGSEVPAGTTATQCCTGYVANRGISNTLRCCLPDYTDVTLYLNRYVSSEGRGLPDTAYDSKTGYIKDPGVVEIMAAQKSLCCSGNVARGVAIWKLFRPLTGGTYLPQLSTDNTSRRFVTREDTVDNNPQTQSVGSIYDQGIRWNNHVYCVPDDYDDPYEQ